MTPTIRRNTRWTPGRTRFKIPALDRYVGPVDGLFPLPVTLDPAIGEEVALFIRDRTPFMEELRQVEPFRLMMKNGCARNRFGPLIFFLFWVENPMNPAWPVVSWDYYLDPKGEAMMAVWRTLAHQTHWHVILAGVGDRQENFFEFENHYGLSEALEVFAAACRRIRSIDFNRTRQVFMDEHSLEALFLMK